MISRHALLVTLATVFLGFLLTSAALADDAKPIRLVGNLTAIDGKNLTLAGENGNNVAVTCNDATKYRRDSAPNSAVTLADLKVGQTLRVYYTAADKVASLVNIVKEP